MSFTPGPWEIDPTGDMGDWAIGTPNRPIATVETDEWWGTEEEWTANAHLIAAAPDMYAALEDAEWGSTTDVADGGYEPGCPVCDGAQSVGHEPGCTLASALAKARGEA